MEKFIETEDFKLEIKNEDKCNSVLIACCYDKRSNGGVVGEIPDLLMGLETITSAICEHLLKEGVEEKYIVNLLATVGFKAMDRVKERKNINVTDKAKMFN